MGIEFVCVLSAGAFLRAGAAKTAGVCVCDIKDASLAIQQPKKVKDLRRCSNLLFFAGRKIKKTAARTHKRTARFLVF